MAWQLCSRLKWHFDCGTRIIKGTEQRKALIESSREAPGYLFSYSFLTYKMKTGQRHRQNRPSTGLHQAQPFTYSTSTHTHTLYS